MTITIHRGINQKVVYCKMLCIIKIINKLTELL